MPFPRTISTCYCYMYILYKLFVSVSKNLYSITDICTCPSIEGLVYCFDSVDDVITVCSGDTLQKDYLYLSNDTDILNA